MPRLGRESVPSRDSSRNRSSMHLRGGTSINFSNVIVVLACLFVLKNVFVYDYRGEEIAQLQAAGKSQEEISWYVPEEARERQQQMAATKSQFERMVTDIAVLKSEVHDLKLKLKLSGNEDVGYTKTGHKRERSTDETLGRTGLQDEVGAMEPQRKVIRKIVKRRKTAQPPADEEEEEEEEEEVVIEAIEDDPGENENALQDAEATTGESLQRVNRRSTIKSVQTIDSMANPHRAQKPLIRTATDTVDDT